MFTVDPMCRKNARARLSFGIQSEESEPGFDLHAYCVYQLYIVGIGYRISADIGQKIVTLSQGDNPGHDLSVIIFDYERGQRDLD